MEVASWIPLVTERACRWNPFDPAVLELARERSRAGPMMAFERETEGRSRPMAPNVIRVLKVLAQMTEADCQTLAESTGLSRSYVARLLKAAERDRRVIYRAVPGESGPVFMWRLIGGTRWLEDSSQCAI